MLDFGSWLGAGGDLSAVPSDTEAERAALAYARILDKPTSVAFRKPNGTTLDAQTVRLESDNRASLAESDAGAAPVRKLIVFGVRNHPDDSIADTDMDEGYRFVSGNDEYRIVDVIEDAWRGTGNCRSTRVS